MSTTTPVVLNSRYELGHIIAEGGMAQVVHARDLLLDRSVAIKILRAQYAASPETLDRFGREARAAASLTHPNLVNIFDVGHDLSHDYHYIVMELLPGRTLKDLVAKGPLALDEAVRLTRQVAQGMVTAHRRGLVHRDLKPQNILLTEEGHAKVGDFGLVQGEEATQLTQPGTVWGTVQYLSPEQAQGLPADARSDIYALGAIFYELLTGQPAYAGGTSAAIMMKHVYDPPPDVSELNHSVPPAASSLVRRAMAKTPDERFQSMEEMAQALSDLLDAASAETAVWGSVRRNPASTWPADDRTRVMPSPSTFGARPVGSPRPAVGVPAVAEPRPLDQPSRPGWQERTEQRRARKQRSRLPLLLAGALLLFFAMMAVGATLAREMLGLEPLASRPLPTHTVAPDNTPVPPRPSPSPTVAVVLAAVPNLLGETIEGAQAKLGPVQLSLEAAEDFTRDVPRGIIAAQDPPANARLEIGKPVRVIVSKGPQRVAVPNVVGAPFTEASERLTSAGFKVQRQDEYNDRAVTGTVFQQSPTGEADAGSTVTLRVSLGRNLATVPEVRGRAEQDARQALEREGFKVDVEYDRFPGVDPGQVFVSDPAPLARVDRGSTVTIRVRRDPTPVPATATTAPAPTATRPPPTATTAPAPSPTPAPAARTTPPVGANAQGQQQQAPGRPPAAQQSPAAPQPTPTTQGR